MPARAVACVGDESATAGSVSSTLATGGAWMAGAVSVTTYAHLKVAGAAALAQASCIFAFSGTQGMTPVTDSSTVTLSPQMTVLAYGGGFMLRDGDSAQDQYGNIVAVSSSGILATA